MLHFYRDVMPCRSAKGTDVLIVRAVTISRLLIITDVLEMLAVFINRVSVVSHVLEILALHQ
jgi:hypothetical protein